MCHIWHIPKSKPLWAVGFTTIPKGFLLRCTPTDAAREGRGCLQTMPNCEEEKPSLDGLTTTF